MRPSIIIPTYNRFASLRRLLKSLCIQSYPVHEVIIVDDGSTDNSTTITKLDLPFNLIKLTQRNQGATHARNNGACQATGDLLVFVDDDIELAADVISVLVNDQRHACRTIVLGTLLSPDTIGASDPGVCGARTQPDSLIVTPFTECFTGLLSIKPADFFALDMFQDPTGGWPNWDDIDFGYRAYLAGFEILRSTRAKAIHHDEAATDSIRSAQRWYRASKSAVRLLQRYPELRGSLSMFRDKAPIDWHLDHPLLIARKMARRLSSTSAAIWIMEQAMLELGRRRPSSSLIHKLHIWICGAYMYRGLREGLREFGPI